MTRPLAFVICTIFMLSAGVASAKPRVALTQIEGDATGEVRTAVAEAIEGKDLSLVGSKEVNRAVDKLGELASLTEKDFKALAIELDADAIVAGKLDKTGATKSLKFRLYIHKRMAKGFTVSFKDAKSEKFRSALHDKMLERITATPDKADDEDDARPAAVDDAAKPAVEGAAPAKPADAKTDAAEPRKADAKPVAAIEPGGPGPGAAVAPHAASARPANLAAARADLGVSAMQRSFAFQTADFANKPRDNSLGLGVGLRIEGEVYPLMFTSRTGKLANLGLGFGYDKTFGLSIATATAGSTAPVTQSSYAIGLRYRWAFGDTPRSGALVFGLDYGQREFAPQRGGLAAADAAAIARDNPATTCVVIDPSVRFRYPVTARLAATLGVTGLLVADAGDILNADSYGQATAYGVQGVVALDVLLGKRFVVRVAGELSQIAFQFKGNGTLSNPDGNATEVTGMTDRSLGGTATLAVVY